jgi:methylated-DNA-protein-cysteine methyltransferase related protein
MGEGVKRPPVRVTSAPALGSSGPGKPKRGSPTQGSPTQGSPTQGSPTQGSPAHGDDAAARIYAVVRSIPRGRVATYGEVAALAGIPSGHRIAARAMRSCPEPLPWQRVLGKRDARRGQINIDDPDHASLQRALLENEGVVFDANGFVSLERSGWRPSLVGPGRAKKRPARRVAARGEGAAPARARRASTQPRRRRG